MALYFFWSLTLPDAGNMKMLDFSHVSNVQICSWMKFMCRIFKNVQHGRATWNSSSADVLTMCFLFYNAFLSCNRNCWNKQVLSVFVPTVHTDTGLCCWQCCVLFCIYLFFTWTCEWHFQTNLVTTSICSILYTIFLNIVMQVGF